jgi:exodeoxyribonuclease VII large subunit
LASHSTGYGLKRVLSQALNEKRSSIEQFSNQISSKVEHFIELAAARTERFNGTLRALNPYGVLERGYAMIQDEKGNLISKTSLVPINNDIQIHLSDGKVRVRRTA